MGHANLFFRHKIVAWFCKVLKSLKHAVKNYGFLYFAMPHDLQQALKTPCIFVGGTSELRART